MNRFQILLFYVRRFFSGPYKSARAIIIRDGKLLAFHRKRLDRATGEWLEHYSIPGGEIDRGETPEQAVVRELREEMGVQITIGPLAAHRTSKYFEHYIFGATIISGEPHFMDDSEEALHYVNQYNQYAVEWVPVENLTVENLKYYGDYLGLIQQLARGDYPKEPVEIQA